MLIHGRKRILIDCGSDWINNLSQLRPDAIVLTQAHPDHAWGLKHGAPCVVYASRDTWRGIATFPIEKRRVIQARKPLRILGVRFEAFPVEHSIRATAVGYRIRLGKTYIFYAPDLIYVHDRHAALVGVVLYIGDGATVTKPFIRKRGSSLIGHAPIRQQLKWCADEGVRRALFTHCGSEIVAGNERQLREKVRTMGAQRGVEADIAYDGLELTLAQCARHNTSNLKRVLFSCEPSVKNGDQKENSDQAK